MRSFDKTEAYKHGQNSADKFTCLSKIGGSLKCFTAEFTQFSYSTVEIGFWVIGWGLAINSKVFRGFLEISLFPKIQS